MKQKIILNFLATEDFTPTQKAKVVLWTNLLGDMKMVQRRYIAVYCQDGKNMRYPSDDEICRWYHNFRHSGSIDTDPDEKQNEEKSTDKHHSKLWHKFAIAGEKMKELFFAGPQIRSFHPYRMEINKELIGGEFLERKNFAEVRF